jgi:hypothetical protein
MSQRSDTGADLGIARVFPVFTLAFAVVYFFGVYFGYGPLHYYPAVNELSLSAQSPEKGPAMMWYGWLITGHDVVRMADQRRRGGDFRLGRRAGGAPEMVRRPEPDAHLARRGRAHGDVDCIDHPSSAIFSGLNG